MFNGWEFLEFFGLDERLVRCLLRFSAWIKSPRLGTAAFLCSEPVCSGVFGRQFLFGSLDTVFDEPRIMTESFVCPRVGWELVSGGVRQRIPAIGCGLGFDDCYIGIDVRSTRQCPLRLCSIRLRHSMRLTAVDDRQFKGALTQLLAGPVPFFRRFVSWADN